MITENTHFLNIHNFAEKSEQKANKRFGIPMEDVHALAAIHGPVRKIYLKIAGTDDQKAMLQMADENLGEEDAHYQRLENDIRLTSPIFYANFLSPSRAASALPRKEVMQILEEMSQEMSPEDTSKAIWLLGLDSMNFFKKDITWFKRAALAIRDQSLSDEDMNQISVCNQFARFTHIDQFEDIAELIHNSNLHLAVNGTRAILSIVYKTMHGGNMGPLIQNGIDIYEYAMVARMGEEAGPFTAQEMLQILDRSSRIYGNSFAKAIEVLDQLRRFLDDSGSEAVTALFHLTEGRNAPSTRKGLQMNMEHVRLTLTQTER